MFTPKIIFFDIDQTLYLKNEHRIPDSAKLALKKLRERGIITAIATGRTLAVFPEPIRDLIAECGIEMLITVNGQYIEFQGKELVSFAMPRDWIERTAAALQTQNMAYACVCRNGIYVSHDNPYIQAASRDLNLPYFVDALAYEKHDVYQMLGFYTAEQAAEIEPLLPESVKTIRWHEFGVDILDKNGSKARGILAALAKLGLQVGDTMAFGDGLNDVDMIELVQVGVAMGNAEPELKAVADHICPNIEDDGIYRALLDWQIIS